MVLDCSFDSACIVHKMFSGWSFGYTQNVFKLLCTSKIRNKDVINQNNGAKVSL